MKNTKIVAAVGIVLALVLGGAFAYRFSHLAKGGKAATAEKEEAARTELGSEGKEGGDKQTRGVRLKPEILQSRAVVVETAKKASLGGVIVATGKVGANADRIAHVSPRIPGKIVWVGASLGDTVVAGQVLARLDSVELGEALSEYYKARSRIALARSNLDRIKSLVEKKIAARKEILQAETEYQTAMSELHADEERLRLYGLSPSEFEEHIEEKRILLPVHSPIAGVVTEKHTIVGELADPSKNLFTVTDLSSVWVLVDINEKDLAKIGRGRPAAVKVGAFPESVFRGRVTYIADLVDEATRTVKARIEVANPGRKLKPEMFATVELAIPPSSSPGLAVPEEALVELEGKKVLFITGDDAEFIPREVATGANGGGWVEVTAGLKEGERYAAKGGFLLKSELKKGELGEE
ncbi:MAG: CzcB family heavy metal efflux protein, cobalt-zinc-cadmium resistance protein CzcB [Deltaproteobacteria bacterium CSP1-8]|nr:MAG: CzcB family heavy metal efflux protein, cobalt-zinc-cadmium resistance protein CzcB [Deltaproteobacteria bacterium CSP1-8]